MKGAIGYVELSYYNANHPRNISEAWIQNKAHKWLKPNVADVLAAASQISGLSPTNFSIVYQPGSNSYAISGFSWAGVYQHQTNTDQCNALVGAFAYETSTGQNRAASHGYSPLPSGVQSYAASQLNQVTCS